MSRLTMGRIGAVIGGLLLVLGTSFAHAQGMRGMPSLPTGGSNGLSGSAGIGFSDFTTNSPSADFKIDRGTFFAAQIERSFDFAHLYLTLGLSYMDAKGTSNYAYTNLSSTTNYSLPNVGFRANLYELTLGLKFKLIDDFWFRPYVEGGGLGRYNDISYDSQLSQLNGTGTDYKTNDVIMGSGLYYEGGIEAQFSDTFAVRLAARRCEAETKALDTLAKRTLRLSNETYYFSVIFGL